MRHRRGGNLFLFDQCFWRVFRRQRRRQRLRGTCGKFLREFRDKTLRRPGAGFAERADSPAGDIVADCFQCPRVFRHAATEQHAVGDFLHPKRTFPARCTLATALMRVKLVDVVKGPNHIARVIQHDDAAGSRH